MIKNKKNKHGLWKRLHFKYRLSAINENTLEEIWKIRASIFSGALLVLIFSFLLITITSGIIITTPIRYYLPGYLDTEIREKAIKSAIKIDSLEQQIAYQEAYLANLRSIFEGKRQIDSVKVVEAISVSESDPALQKSKSEKEYTERYREEEKYNLSVLPSALNTPMEGVSFFKPLKGVVARKFDVINRNYGISISVSNRETVLSVLEGTVIFTGYDVSTRYTIQVQHKNGFVSIYSNNASLLKKIGDKVKTGEAIALVGDNESDNKNQSTQLLFELWYKGLPVNPEEYISF